MAKSINTPHDLFVKASFKDIRIATDFLKTYLPQSIQSRIDFTTLKPTDKEFVLPKLKRLQSDIIYQCQIDEQAGYIYCLVEHQVTPDELMAFRRLQYNVALMDDHLRQGHKKLPIIVSLCIYHGKQSPYPHSTDIYDCFNHPELARQVSFQPFHLIDLTVLADQEIEQHGLAALMELLLKHHNDKQIVKFIKKLYTSGTLQRTLTAIDDTNYLTSVLYYTLNVGEDNQQEADEVIETFIKALPQARKEVMTLADQLRQQGVQQAREEVMTLADQLRQQGVKQGMQQGVQQGIEQEKYEVAKKMLRKGMDSRFIAEIINLPAEAVLKLKEGLYEDLY